MKYRTDDAYLIRYLRYRKFKCDEAYKIIHNFYKTRKESPELFALTPNLESSLKTEIFTYLPYRDHEGSIIFVNKFGKCPFYVS